MLLGAAAPPLGAHHASGTSAAACCCLGIALTPTERQNCAYKGQRRRRPGRMSWTAKVGHFGIHFRRSVCISLAFSSPLRHFPFPPVNASLLFQPPFFFSPCSPFATPTSRHAVEAAAAAQVRALREERVPHRAAEVPRQGAAAAAAGASKAQGKARRGGGRKQRDGTRGAGAETEGCGGSAHAQPQSGRPEDKPENVFGPRGRAGGRGEGEGEGEQRCAYRSVVEGSYGEGEGERVRVRERERKKE